MTETEKYYRQLKRAQQAVRRAERALAKAHPKNRAAREFEAKEARYWFEVRLARDPNV